MGFLLNFGISDASLQYIGKYKFSSKKLWRFIAISICLILALTPFQISYFNSFGDEGGVFISRLCLLAIMSKLVIDQVDLQLGANLKAAGRFQKNLMIDIVFKLLIYTVGIYVIYALNSIPVFFHVALCATLLKVIFKNREVRQCEYFYDATSSVDKAFPRKQFAIVSLGFFIMAFNGYTLAFVERLLLPGILDLQSIGHIAVATQVALFIHSLPAAGMSFLLPLLSTGKQAYSLVSMFLISFVLSFSMLVIVYLFAEHGLNVWLQSESSVVKGVIYSLAPPVFLYSLCIVPYYSLMASKKGFKLSLIMLVLSGGFVLFLSTARTNPLTLASFVQFKVMFIYLSGLSIYGYFIFTKIVEYKNKKSCP
ncbi:MAG: hypothetical protein P8N61_01260 [Porticoccaceae bacterium]|nr:hypothetical protein [Porticoccaceae bacterium]